MTSPFLMRPETRDASRRRAAIASLRAAQVTLPTWTELARPSLIPDAVDHDLTSVCPDEPNGKNLWRVHWFNDAKRRDRTALPGHVILPEALTGVKAPIVVMLGRRFPMIGSHKVLDDCTCLVSRMVMDRLVALGY